MQNLSEWIQHNPIPVFITFLSSVVGLVPALWWIRSWCQRGRGLPEGTDGVWTVTSKSFGVVAIPCKVVRDWTIHRNARISLQISQIPNSIPNAHNFINSFLGKSFIDSAGKKIPHDVKWVAQTAYLKVRQDALAGKAQMVSES